eukprot:189187-Chlamydomonas_euryale.AAC.2
MMEHTTTVTEHAFSGFSMTLPDSAQRLGMFAELHADGQAKYVAWGRNLAAAVGISPNASCHIAVTRFSTRLCTNAHCIKLITGCSDNASKPLNPECWMANSNIGDENDAPPGA